MGTVIANFVGAYFITLTLMFLVWIMSRARWQYTVFFFWKKDGHIGEWLYWAVALTGIALMFLGDNPDFTLAKRTGVIAAILTHMTYAIISEDYFDADYKLYQFQQAVTTWRRSRTQTPTKLKSPQDGIVTDQHLNKLAGC